jgi:phytanoyl-CoA hydroxylase
MINKEHIRQFQKDGCVILDRILNEEQIEKAMAAMARVYAGEFTNDRRPGELRGPMRDFDPGHVKHYVHARFLDQDFWDIATDPGLGKMVADLLQTESVSLVEDQLLEKPAGGGSFAMHQDYSYWGFSDRPQMLTLWITLTESTQEMGPIEFARGSHKWPLVPPPGSTAPGDDDQLMDAVRRARPDESEIEWMPVIVPAGGGSFHHGMTMHGSRASSSERNRYAISLHYAAAECRVTDSSLPWHPFIWEGVRPGDRPTSPFMPVVYNAD